MARELKELDRRELEHAIKNIFSSTSNEYSQVKSMINQEHIEDIHQITSLTAEDIEGLTYVEIGETGSSTSPIPKWMISRIKIGLALHSVKCRKEGRLIPWMELGPDDLVAFRRVYDPRRVYPKFIPNSPYRPTSNTPRSGKKITPSKEFIDNPKTDSSKFPIFRDDTEWYKFQREFEAEAKVQGVGNVIDASYLPVTKGEVALFKTHNNYLWQVFNTIIRTPRSKEIVSNHSRNKSARMVYQELVKSYTASPAVRSQAVDIFSQLANANIAVDRGTMSRQAYIEQWVSGLEYYNDTTYKGSQVTDGLCMNLLKDVVKGDYKLEAVSTQDFTTRPRSTTHMNYATYKTLLLEAAKKADKEDIRTLTADATPNHGDRYDFGTQEKIKSNLHGPSIDRKTYDSLGKSSQRGWQQMTPDSKTAILGRSKGRGTQSQEHTEPATRSAEPPSTPQRDGNPTSISTTAIVTEPEGVGTDRDIQRINFDTPLGETRPGSQPSPDPGPKAPPPAPDPENTQGSQVNSPGTQPSTGPDPDASSYYRFCSINEIRVNPTEDQPTPQITNPGTYQNHDMERALDTKKRRFDDDEMLCDPPNYDPGNIASIMSDDDHTEGKKEVLHTMTYHAAIPKRRPKKGGSLINKRTTGGVLGLDAIAIKTTDRHINVSGINNRETPSLPIGTGAAYIMSKQGPFIGIFGQYAISERGKTVHSTAQLESIGAKVGSEFDLLTDGPHVITTKCQREIPTEIIGGLIYMDMRPYSENEFTELPHIQMTSETEWDPITLRDMDTIHWPNCIVPSKTLLINNLELINPDNPTEGRIPDERSGRSTWKES